MAEYIKKDELLKFKSDVYDEDGHVLYAVPTGYIVVMPPADVAPVRHGKWTSIGYDCGENEYQCSECHRTEWRESADDMKFCMFCGAKMDLDNER